MNQSDQPRRWPLIALSVGLVAMNLGCSKKEETPAAKPSPPASVSVDAPTETPAAKVEGATEELPNPGLLKPGTLNDDGVEVGAGALTDALQTYYYNSAGQIPASLEDMVRLKIVGRIPTPPKGKKYVLDRKKVIVTLENAP